MNHPLAIWCLRAIEVMFFTGLVGCAVVVVISWVSIVKTGFSKDIPSDSR